MRPKHSYNRTIVMLISWLNYYKKFLFFFFMSYRGKKKVKCMKRNRGYLQLAALLFATFPIIKINTLIYRYSLDGIEGGGGVMASTSFFSLFFPLLRASFLFPLSLAVRPQLPPYNPAWLVASKRSEERPVDWLPTGLSSRSLQLIPLGYLSSQPLGRESTPGHSRALLARDWLTPHCL